MYRRKRNAVFWRCAVRARTNKTMKTKTITLYEYAELSPQAKEKALNKWRETEDDPFMQSHMINLLKEELDERGIKYDAESVDVRYSLSSCQGDGFMFEGELVWGKYTIYIKHDGNSHYYHSNTANIEMQETDNLGFHMDDEHADVKAFDALYHEICKKMERVGYEHIEYVTSEESFEQACEANEWTFREDGTREDT